MKRNNRARMFSAYASVLALFIPCHALAQDQDTVWAQSQQAALAEDILNCDREQCWRAVFVAEALGPSRMSEDVRVALMTLLERYNDELDSALSRGIVRQDVVDGEFFLQVADVVAALDDVRTIPVLVRVGNHGFSRRVAHSLAAFGEQALPTILEAIDAPEVSDFSFSNNLFAISIMVKDGGADLLSVSARQELIRVARNGLHSQRGGAALDVIDLAVALNEPDLVRTVREFSQDTSELIARGVDRTTADLIRQRALDAVAPASGDP